MPLQDHMQIISVDDHLIEHPRVFSDRLPAAMAADGPRIIEDEQGNHVWRMEGQIFPYIGLNAVAGKEPKDFGMEPLRYAVAIALFATNLMWSTVDLLFSGQLQKHPNLKIMLSEGGIGWLPR